MRLLFYSHDGLGLGHVRRNLAIAAAVAEADPGASVLLVSSSDHVDGLVIPPRVDVLKLPGVRKTADGRYAARRLGTAGPQTWALRAALITAATRAFAPHVVLADKHPLGAHGELREALDVLAASGGRAVLGLRDILDEPSRVRAEWERHGVVDAVRRHYHRVLVYGSRSVLDHARAYGLPPDLAGSRLRYCGYVVGTSGREGALPPLGRAGDPRPVVLATVGAGEDGASALDLFVRASVGAAWQPVVVSGGDAPVAQQEQMRAALEALGGASHRFVRDLPAAFGAVAALVCMGGYNTLAEAMAAAVPTVVLPRTSPRSEQLLRAQAFQELGLARCVVPVRGSELELAGAVRDAMRVRRDELGVRVRRSLDLDGARRAASHLLALGNGDEPDDREPLLMVPPPPVTAGV